MGDSMGVGRVPNSSVSMQAVLEVEKTGLPHTTSPQDGDSTISAQPTPKSRFETAKDLYEAGGFFRFNLRKENSVLRLGPHEIKEWEDWVKKENSGTWPWNRKVKHRDWLEIKRLAERPPEPQTVEEAEQLALKIADQEREKKSTSNSLPESWEVEYKKQPQSTPDGREVRTEFARRMLKEIEAEQKNKITEKNRSEALQTLRYKVNNLNTDLNTQVSMKTISGFDGYIKLKTAFEQAKMELGALTKNHPPDEYTSRIINTSQLQLEHMLTLVEIYNRIFGNKLPILDIRSPEVRKLIEATPQELQRSAEYKALLAKLPPKT